MVLHKTLTRQLNRVGLQNNVLPSHIEEWQSFLKSINNVYQEFDQERYLVERSIEISSNEFSEFTKRLETAQHIAHLGDFTYDIQEESFILSNNLYSLFGFKEQEHIINREKFLKLVHEEERPFLLDLIHSVLSGDTRSEKEIRIINAEGEYRWFNFIGTLNDPSFHSASSFFGIAMDINQRKLTEKKLADLNQELINTARFAGMADVAISVLHNVGNAINSANVALNLIYETLTKSTHNKLGLIIKLLKENEATLGDYLTRDPKGKIIPTYLSTLNDVIMAEQNTIRQEIDNISHSLKHTKEIIAAQQTVSKVSTQKERLLLQEIIDDTLKITGVFLTQKNILFSKKGEDISFIYADKTKLTQIMVNLFQNAQESLDGITQTDKKIKLNIRQEEGKLFIEVEDNGIGIQSENLKKLFKFGFTTKAKGHGFGLHSSILAAREMGGDLIAESEGEGKGAKFILSLPLSG